MGEKQKVIYVHPAVLTQGESAISARVTGRWADVSENVIDWSEFDECTVDSVVHYLYFKDYKIFESPTQDVPGEHLTRHDATALPNRSHHRHRSHAST